MDSNEVMLLKESPILGKNINLRISKESDAEFILDLRLNPLLNKFIGETDPDVENQRTWIRNSFNKTTDFNFIIEDKNANRIGTVAIYDIDYKERKAEWGRWIMIPGTSLSSPIETPALLLNFAFKELKLNFLYGGANNLNKVVVDFHKLYADISSEDESYTYFTFEEKNLKILLEKFKSFHNTILS